MNHSSTRRDFLKYTAAGAALLALPRWLTAANTSEKKRPNIIFIYSDDLGHCELGAFGQEKIKTPRLDRMAAEGMKLTAFYSMPTCSPSRACLLTGQNSLHTTQGNNNTAGVPLRPTDVTIGRVMKEAGYATGQVGKWAIADNLPPEIADAQSPWNQGFDFAAGNMKQGSNGKWITNYLQFDRDGSVTGKATPQVATVAVTGGKAGKVYVDDLHFEKAEAFINAKAGKSQPFFLYLATRAPHNPYQPPSLGEYEKVDWKPNQNLGSYGDVKAYAASITYLDGQVGRLLDLLKQKGIEKDTLVIFSSDNGSVYSRTTLNRDGGSGFFKSSGIWRGGKWDSLEGGVRESSIACWPGTIKAGSRCDVPIGQYELMATCAELAGVKPPASSDGTSFLPELMGKPNAERMVIIIGGRVRVGNYEATVKGGRVATLYDLTKDPRQERTENLAGTMPALEAKIAAFAAKEFAKQRLRGRAGRNNTTAPAAETNED